MFLSHTPPMGVGYPNVTTDHYSVKRVKSSFQFTFMPNSPSPTSLTIIQYALSLHRLRETGAQEAFKMDVRFSHVIGLGSALALGASVVVGVSVFGLLAGRPELVAALTPQAYLLAGLMLLPLALTFAERASAAPGSGGVYNQARANGSVLGQYLTGWLMLGGYACLAGVTGWAIASYLNGLLARLFEIVLNPVWLAIGAVLFSGLSGMLGTRGNWLARNLAVYGGLAALLALTIWGALTPVKGVAETPTPSPAGNPWEVLPSLLIALWGAEFLVNQRDLIRHPAKTLWRALVGNALLLGILGGGGAAVVARAGLNRPEISLPLAALAADFSPIAGLLLVVVALAVLHYALNQTFVNALRLAAALTRDGFLPERLQARPGGGKVPVYALLLMSAGVTALVYTLTLETLLSFAVSAILLATVIVNLPYIFRPLPTRTAERRFTLPLHPLFPALGVLVSGILLAASFSRDWWLGLIWLGVGVLIYALYGRQGAIVARQRAVLVGEAVSTAKDIYRVLVGIANPQTAVTLLEAAVRLARNKNGEVLALQVLTLPEQMPSYEKRRVAHKSWNQLHDFMDQLPTHGVPIKPLVRLAPSPDAGILETVWEEEVSLVLLGWPGDQASPPAIIQKVVRSAPAQVAILHGTLPPAVQHVTVPLGNRHTASALELGEMLLSENGSGTALNLQVTPAAAPGAALAATSPGQATMPAPDDASGGEGRPADLPVVHEPYELRLVQAPDLKSAILQETDDNHLLLIGVTTDEFLETDIFGGVPVEVALERPGPTMLVKRREDLTRYWWRRTWQETAGLLPTLTREEQAAVLLQMRRDANATIDFYLMILLSAAIAYFGLLQDSSAVIIGAMLVAPLMSPMMAMAHSIAQGNLMVFRQASGSTVRGILAAVGVSMAFTLLMAGAAPPTNEILVRTAPNLLDLLVAVVSGAAAAYALSRKEVAAALPGVAIAAALVPPLSVIGYGLGSGRFDIAGGALLLFGTNLASILLSGTLVFLMLGFRPTFAERIDQVRRSLFFALVALGLVAVPLSIATVRSVQHARQQAVVEAILQRAVRAELAEVEDVRITRDGEGYLVEFTAYAFTESPKMVNVGTIRDAISEAVKAPVTLRARIIPAVRAVLEETATPTPTPSQ